MLILHRGGTKATLLLGARQDQSAAFGDLIIYAADRLSFLMIDRPIGS